MQGTALPAVVLHLISHPGEHTLDGPMTQTTARVQVDCWGLSFAAAKALGRAVRAALDGHRGGGFQGILYANARDDSEGDDGADRLFRTSLDFTVRFSTT